MTKHIDPNLIKAAKKDLAIQMAIRINAMSRHTGLSKEFCSRLAVREMGRGKV